MVLFQEVLVEKNGKIICLKHVGYDDLIRVMVNSDLNVIHLINDRTMFFNKNDSSNYGVHDFRRLQHSKEVFERVIVQKMDEEKILLSTARKNFLVENLFQETKICQQAESTSVAVRKFDEPDAAVSMKLEVAPNAEHFPGFDLNNVSNIDLIDEELQDDDDDNDDLQKKESIFDQSDDTHFDIDEEQDKNMSYFEKQMLHGQRQLLGQINHLGRKVEELNRRMTQIDQKVAYLYEKQSMPNLIKVLNEEHLIEIRNLDTRMFCCSSSPEMSTFFRFTAREFQTDYEERWKSMENWLNISFRPRAIECDLLGFGSWNKVHKDKNWKLKPIESPPKLTPQKVLPRSSFITYEKDFGESIKNVIVLFEVTTSTVYSTFDDSQLILNKFGNKYTESMKKLLKKLCQLERQVFYLKVYYSLPIYQFFTGLVIFELYRNPNTSPGGFLNNMMKCETIKKSVPLLCQLYELGQFILSY